ncbi:MAG: hypothetical protein JWO38_4453 [Gemmataceae bacterium]|nr:hypothetical protein [Gemmataceae bacterium]
MADTRAEGDRVAHPLFHAGGDGSQPISALQLHFAPIGLAAARRLNLLWHSRLPVLGHKVPDWVCYAAEGPDGLFYAVAVWSPPVARHLPQDGTCRELRRLAIAPDAPRNTASRMLGWMAREVNKSRPEVTRLISYQDRETHTGAIYRAAGWVPHSTPRGGPGWSSRRGRGVAARVRSKIRWEKALPPRTAANKGKPPRPTWRQLTLLAFWPD